MIDIKSVLEFANFDRKFTGIAKYPAVTRDISMLVPKQVLAGQIEEILAQRGGNILESYQLFDIYEGSTDQGRLQVYGLCVWYSVLTIRLLEESEISAAMKKILNGLERPWNRAEKLMLLYIVRHGLTPWNHLHKAQGSADIPLASGGN